MPSGTAAGAHVIYVAVAEALLVIRPRTGGWVVEEALAGKSLQCVAVDLERREHIYAGTAADGLWRSADGGRTWTPVGTGIAFQDIRAVAVGPSPAGGPGTVYAGTEPSAAFRSTDGGDTWTALDGLAQLPSAPTWSFPPRPDTHHVRWIAVDPGAPRRLYAAIEAGALVRSPDGGDTWTDRVPGGPYDTHTLALHPAAPGRLYAAAGDGYFESRDGGDTWEEIAAGLRHGYLFGVAVDPADPDAVVVSAASGPGAAYDASRAAAHIYARRGRGVWVETGTGLPDPAGTTVSALATNPETPHVIYAASNRGIFVSSSSGADWQRLEVDWPARLERHAVRALAVC